MFGRTGAARRQLENRHLAAQASQMEARAELDSAEARRVQTVTEREERDVGGETVVQGAMFVGQEGAAADPREAVRQEVLDELQAAERAVADAGSWAARAIGEAERAKATLEAADERRKACRLELRRVAEGRV
jgi:hypothetical protein